jgi:aminopeptidase
MYKEAEKNIRDLLHYSIKFEPDLNQKALVIFDTENGLTEILTQGYKKVLPEAKFLEFNSLSKEQVLNEFNSLKKDDLVVLIQSTNFRLDEFRIRLHLFNMGLKVVEHMHLYRNIPDQWLTYIQSLSYNPDYYNKTGSIISEKLTNSNLLEIKYQDKVLTIDGRLEKPKLNIGNYDNLPNVGGTFPIGEVFTEVVDFKSMHGVFFIRGYANSNFDVIFCEPFWVKVENSLIIALDEKVPIDFAEIINKVKNIETPLIREIGIGINPYITFEKPLGDITAFERNIGIHLSLGHKHSVYKKSNIVTHKARFHIDLFLCFDEVLVNEIELFDK